jgi:hypothetical protein
MATCGLAARWAVLTGVRPVITQPTGRPSRTWKIGCRMRERGRPAASTVVAVHQTISDVNSRKSAAKGANEAGMKVSFLARRAGGRGSDA